MHFGQKPFKCRYCQKGFVQQGNKTDHELRHTNTKPFTCPEDDCHKTFYRKALLKAHCKEQHRKDISDKEVKACRTKK